MNDADLRVLLRYLDLVAAALATLHADRDGEPDPLWYLRDELREAGHLPADLDAYDSDRSAR